MRITSGPWRADNGTIYAEQWECLIPVTLDGVERQHNAGMIALVYSKGDGSGDDNARLMAAAPKLIAALRATRDTLRAQMAENWSEEDWPETVFYAAYQQADDLINEIEGRK